MASRSISAYGLLFMGLLMSSITLAQFRLPPFDIELKVQETFIPSDNNNNQTATVTTDYLETTNFYGAAHLQIGQHLALGWLYAQSFRGTLQYSTSNSSQASPPDGKASLLMFGPDIRYATSRAKKTRFSISFNYTQIEFVDDKGTYRLAHKSNAVGLSLGIVKRLSNTIDLNLIELGSKGFLGEKAFWMEAGMMLEVKTGLTFNFSKRK